MTDNVVQLRPQPYSFDLFWSEYPKKHSIGPARGQWMWALAKVNNDAQVLIEGAKRYAEYCRREGTEDRYIAKAGNWLAEERWLDVYEKPSAVPSEDLELKRKAQAIESTGRSLMSVSDHQARQMVAKGWLSVEQAKRAGYAV